MLAGRCLQLGLRLGLVGRGELRLVQPRERVAQMGEVDAPVGMFVGEMSHPVCIYDRETGIGELVARGRRQHRLLDVGPLDDGHVGAFAGRGIERGAPVHQVDALDGQGFVDAARLAGLLHSASAIRALPKIENIPSSPDSTRLNVSDWGSSLRPMNAPSGMDFATSAGTPIASSFSAVTTRDSTTHPSASPSCITPPAR